MHRVSANVKPYAFIAGFGFVSLFMDIVYEGALAVQGPLLLSLGASAALVGLVSGLGEVTSLAGRLFTGPAADRTGRYWVFAIAGYAITAMAVPAMGFAGSVAAVAVLIIVERLGKAVRTPSRDAMLSHASAAVGRGKGFALHEALDQVGAVAGPLIVAGILWLTSNDYAPALGVLAIPGVIAICILLRLKAKVPDPCAYETAEASAAAGGKDAPAQRNPGIKSLPRRFWIYSLACGLCLSGTATFAVMSFHAVSCGALTATQVPVVYAAAMGIDAVAALVTGSLYDRIGPRTLLALPIVCAAVPYFAYGTATVPVIAGALLWGLAMGIQESTMRAYVADLVQQGLRATSYGVFSMFVGVGTLIGGTLAGSLYQAFGPVFVIAAACAIQLCAFALLLVLLRRGDC